MFNRLLTQNYWLLSIFGLSLAAVTSLGSHPAIAQTQETEIEPPYTSEELEALESDINSTIEGEADGTDIPGPIDDFNFYSEDEYDIYEGIDAFEIRDFPDQPDIYDEQPGVIDNAEQ